MRKVKGFVLLFLFFGQFLMAQTDTAAIREYPDKVQVSLLNFYQDFNFSAGLVNNSTISYRNAIVKTGLRVRVRKIGLALSFPVAHIHPAKGSLSKNLALLFNLYPKKVNVTGSIRRVKGFDQLTGTDEIFRPDVKLLHFEAAGTYIFNKNFSLRAPFRFIEKQVKNAGSLLVIGTADLKGLEAKDSLFNISQDLLAPIGKMKELTFGTGAGYGFTRTEGNWFFTGLFTGGGEVNRRRYFDNTGQQTSNIWQLRPVVIGQVAFGYNADQYFVGMASFFRPGFGAVNNVDASFYRFRASLVAGVRIDGKGFLRKKKK